MPIIHTNNVAAGWAGELVGENGQEGVLHPLTIDIPLQMPTLPPLTPKRCEAALTWVYLEQ